MLPATLSITALFLAGMQTSTHCVLMCGGLNSAAGRLGTRWVWLHAGRVMSYTLAGVVAGSVGSVLVEFLPDDSLAMPIRVALGLAMVALGIFYAYRSQHRACPRAHAHTGGPLQTLGQGFAWGLVPCPMLYATLLVAALSASAASGGMLMLAFGLGTIPAFALQSEILSRFVRHVALTSQQRGYLISACGLFVVVSALWLPDSFGMFCRT